MTFYANIGTYGGFVIVDRSRTILVHRKFHLGVEKKIATRNATFISMQVFSLLLQSPDQLWVLISHKCNHNKS